MRVSDILRGKGSAVATIGPSATVAELLARLAEHNIGAMVVLAPDGIAGIVSERDVVRRLHDVGGGLLERPVAEIMSTDVATCAPDDAVDRLNAVMTDRRIRHLPVVQDGRLVGIVSIGDVVKVRMRELQDSTEQLEAYITHG
ncbi:CBS domain-containing protein [Microlunatus parietis]|uniref:CBS domain-containing protein n=1 Tax=Microlunatus parietis TaxID=682979 RepID=A0A7Y9I5G2_9ACTN|nr:CBS domain-containing protein [Microlunatus parietis]NYE70638.1 CBS domain-containing protein [Microlunatus parietis]